MQNIKIGDKVEVCDIGDGDEWDGGWYFIGTVEGKHICTPEEKNIKTFLSCDSYMDDFAPFDYVRKVEETNEKLPTQGEMIEVKHNDGDYIRGQKFVCLYKGKVIIERADAFFTYDEWRFPEEKETVTLSNGKTYFVEDRGDEMVLILKN